MRTVPLTVDESRVEQVDQAAQALGTTRSAFTREQELERRHRAGYESKPVQPGELSDWEGEQVWPEELYSSPDKR
jgi:hypothetical protein